MGGIISMKRISFFVLLLFFISNTIQAQNSSISGRVTDATSNEVLIGVNIIVNEIENLGTTTGLEGKFFLKLPAGSYSVKISYLGYTTVVKTDVIALSGQDNFQNIKLSPSTIEMDEAVVQADYFDKSIQINNVATVVLGAEEIKRSPGSMQDFQRLLQGMAGVSFSNDQNNELLVRGGSPNENLTILDEMELHSTNHYPNEYNSGGPINMINTDLIENIQFSTGGFISKFGDKLSSVMKITTREGTRSTPLAGDINISMAGAGGILEGGFANGKGSWVLSARKSYIDLIAGAVGLTAIPKYYDLQFKAVYDLSINHKLSLSAIYGNDRILIDGDDEESDYEKRNTIDTLSTSRVDLKQFQYAAGLTLKSIWSKNTYSSLTLFYNGFHSNVNVNTLYSQIAYDDVGNVENKNTYRSKPIHTDKHENKALALKGEFSWNPTTANELTFGGMILTGDFLQNITLPGNTARYFIQGEWTPDIIVPDSKFEIAIKMFSQYKSYLFINDQIKLFKDKLVLNAGLRYDYFSYSNKGNISPRFSGSYYLIPGITNINFAYGEYYQTQNYPTYGDRFNSQINRYLKNTHARHFVLGFEHILGDGLKVSVEAYYKSYTDIPVSEEFIHFDDKTFRSEKSLNVGEKTVKGIDILFQQKLVKDIFGTLCYSRMWTEFEDPRIGYEGKHLISDYDFPHVVTLILGKRFSGLRESLDKSNFLLKYLSYILPFSDDMEISLRWRYASGTPYSKRTWTTTEQYLDDETGWSNGSWSTNDAINNERYPDYHRLDLAFNSRYNFDNWSLAIYLSIQNVYNRKNVAFYEYKSDAGVSTVYQFEFLPVIGIDVRF